MQDHHIPKLHE